MSEPLLRPLKIEYSCNGCGLEDAAVYMAYRLDEEPILEWMKKVQAVVGDDHRRRKPMCPSRTMRQLKIPITNAEWIGGPPVQ